MLTARPHQRQQVLGPTQGIAQSFVGFIDIGRVLERQRPLLGRLCGKTIGMEQPLVTKVATIELLEIDIVSTLQI